MKSRQQIGKNKIKNIFIQIDAGNKWSKFIVPGDQVVSSLTIWHCMTLNL